MICSASRRTAANSRAALFTHQLGWEVRLLVGSQSEVIQTQVCRDQEGVLRTGGGLKQAMIERGGDEGVPPATDARVFALQPLAI